MGLRLVSSVRLIIFKEPTAGVPSRDLILNKERDGEKKRKERRRVRISQAYERGGFRLRIKFSAREGNPLRRDKQQRNNETNGLAQLALHTSDIFHVCQESDATRCSPIRNQRSVSRDPCHRLPPSKPASTVKNANSTRSCIFSFTLFKGGRYRGLGSTSQINEIFPVSWLRFSRFRKFDTYAQAQRYT